MIDVETTLRRGLHALADEIDPVTPPLPRPARRRWRRPLVVGVFVGGTLLGGAAATGTGLLPEPVQSMFDRSTAWGPYGVDPDDARLVATASLDGTTWEYWVADGPTGGRCEHVRQVRAEVSRESSAACFMPSEHGQPPDQLWASGGTGRGPDTIGGRAPVGAVAVLVTLGDGRQDRLPIQRDRHFFGVYEATVTALDAVDGAGAVLDHQDW
ncbi:MAG: hypothetical protein JWO68_2736 [Actinomycetia bacterium]|nr:hypothetical protein [Actinomycetes bacterium]